MNDTVHSVIKMLYNLVIVISVVLLTTDLAYTSTSFYDRLGVSKGASLKDIRKGFKKIALIKHPDKNKDPNAHDEFLKITRAYEVLKDDDLRKKYDMHGEEGLKEDFHGGREYESWNFYQNEFGLYDDDESIITLSKADFAQSVEGYDGVWFINYYSPHCSHCHDLAPTWRELGREMDGVIRIGAVNCGDEWYLCQMQGVHSYPTLIVYPSGVNYRGSRDKENLVKYAMQYVKTKVHTLTLKNLKENTVTGGTLPWLVTFCMGEGDCLSKRTCVKLSTILSGLVNVAYVDCDKEIKLCKKLGQSEHSFFYPDHNLNKDTALEITSLHTKDVASQVFNQLPDFTLMDESSFKAMEDKLKAGKDHAWLVHFVNEDVQELELKKLPAMLDNINIGRVDCSQLNSVCQRLHVYKYPSFMMFKLSRGHELYYGRHTAFDVAAFAKDSLLNQLETLTPAHFPDITSNNELWIIDYFAPWCPPCMHFLPEFKKASRHSEKGIKFGTLDCSIHSSTCSKQNVHSYPTTIFYNMSKPHQFHGGHNMDDVLDFIQDILKPTVISLQPDTFVSKVLKRPNQEMWAVDFFLSSCHPCRELAPQWRRLAKVMLGTPDVYVADIDCGTHRSFCKEQGVNSYPTIRFYGRGEAKRFEKYSSWNRDADSLHSWVVDLMPSMVSTLSYETFMEKVLNSETPWLVDFYTNWCGQCHVFKPTFESVAQELEGRVSAGKVDCDREAWLCENANVRGYPTVMYYPGRASHDGSFVGESLRVTTESDIIKKVEHLLRRPERLKVVRDEF